MENTKREKTDFILIKDINYGYIIVNRVQVKFVNIVKDTVDGRKAVLASDDGFKKIEPYKLLIFLENKDLKDRGADFTVKCEDLNEASYLAKKFFGVDY